MRKLVAESSVPSSSSSAAAAAPSSRLRFPRWESDFSGCRSPSGSPCSAAPTVRARLRLPPESRGDRGALRGQGLRVEGPPGLRRRAGPRRRLSRPVPRRPSEGAAQGYDPAVGGLAANGFGEHSPGTMALGPPSSPRCPHVHLPHRDPRRDHEAAVAGFAGIPIGLTLTLVHLDRHPDHQPVGESGAEHRSGDLRRRLGARTALAVLAGPILGAAAAGLLGAWLHEDGRTAAS